MAVGNKNLTIFGLVVDAKREGGREVGFWSSCAFCALSAPLKTA
jgi:hypothetical protein